MRRVAAWMLAFGLVISPVASAANGTDTDKKASDTAKKNPKSDSKSTAPATPSNAEIAAEVEQLRAMLKEQSEQIAALRAALERRDGAAPSAPAANATGTPSAASNASAPGTSAANASSPANPAPAASAARQENKESPLSFRIGGAEFTPGGFVDFENVFRSTNASNASSTFSQNNGNSIGTNFGLIPFNNTIQGHLTEFRSTAQYSRFSLKVTDKFGANNVTGYIEGDFNGNDAANSYVSQNSHTLGLRLYWLDLKRGKWEFLGGQSWGLMTPNRVGLSPMPDDLALTLNEDAHIQVGIPYTRAAQFRAVYHPNDHWAWGVAIENPQQFVGFGETIYPFAFNAALSPQFDATNNTNTPNVAPDFNTKIAYDSNPGGRHFHFEIGGLLTTVKATVVPVGGITFESHTKIGGGIEGGANIELAKDFRFVVNGLWGNGVGRYLFGLGPQTVIVPIQTGPTNFDINPSLVHAGGGTAGFEGRLWKHSEFGAYYGAVYFQRNDFPDVTSPLLIKPIIGFGGINSPNSANRAIQEGTFDWTQTFWRSEQHGALQFVTQYSYLTRAPWFVATGAPKNAHLSMAFLSLRYVLP